MNDTPPPPAAAPRTNRAGDPCPPWCTTDHEAHDGLIAVHMGDAGLICPARSLNDWLSASPVRHPLHTAPYVAVHAHKGAEHGLILQCAEPRDIAAMAGIVEMLAAATPAQHRELAAAIRAAAAVIETAPGVPGR